MASPALSGHYLNDKEAIAKLFTENYVNILPRENSLNFFVQCSEERLYRVRNGIRLKDVVENHKNIFGSLVKQRKPAHSNEEEHKKLKQALILGLDQTDPRPVTHSNYFSVEVVKTSPGKTSPGMREYLHTRKFDPELERKKHHFLPSYFFERYSKVSSLLNERHNSETSEISSPAAFAASQGTRKNNHKGIPLESEDPLTEKIDEIDEAIRRQVDEAANLRKKDEQLRMQKESYIASLMHNKKTKKAGTDFIDHRYLKLKALGRTVYSRPLDDVKPRIVEFLDKAVFPDTPPQTAAAAQSTERVLFTPRPQDQTALVTKYRSAGVIGQESACDPVRESEELLLKFNSAYLKSSRQTHPSLTPSGKIREIVTRALSIERAL